MYGMVYKKIDENLENACIQNVSGHCPFYEVLRSTRVQVQVFSTSTKIIDTELKEQMLRNIFLIMRM